MKRKIAIPIVLILGIVLMSISTADEHEDTADVREAHANRVAAWYRRDVEGILQYTHPEFSSFNREGEILEEGWFGKNGWPIVKNNLQAYFDAEADAGIKTRFQYRHQNYKIYGNTAVATYYKKTTVSKPDGSTKESRWWRLSAVWVLEDGKWRAVHGHYSPLIIESPDDDGDDDDNDAVAALIEALRKIGTPEVMKAVQEYEKKK